MKFPPELVEEIIGHIPRSDKNTLQNCSLVSKSWAYSGQKRLFEIVHLSEWDLPSWLENISPTSTTLLGHVRQLSYDYSGREVEAVHHDLRDYLLSFCKLRTFSLYRAHITSHPHPTEFFSVFHHTLSTLSLWNCTVTKNGFTTLISCFPNLTSLFLHYLNHSNEDEPTPPLSRSHLKTLSVDVWPEGGLVLLNELSGLGMRFDEVSIDTKLLLHPVWSGFVKRIIDVFGANAKRLRLFGRHDLNWNFLTLSRCRELREFEASRLYPNDAELVIISSITSTKIQKITLTDSSAFERPVCHPYWTQLDDILVGLVDRSECGLGWEVDFRALWISPLHKDPKSDLTEYLPKFAEKGGRIIISDWMGGLIYYSERAREGG